MSFLRPFLILNIWIRILILFVFIWCFVTLVSFAKLNNDEIENTNKRVNRTIILYLEQIKQKHEAFKILKNEYLMSDNTFILEDKSKILEQFMIKLDKLNLTSDGGPTLAYQKLIRRIRTNTDELWNLIKSEVHNVKNKLPNNIPVDVERSLNNLLELGLENKRALVKDIEDLQKNNNYEKWRFQEAEKLSNLVQKRLNYLQNPEDCNTARKLVCQLNNDCGYGCQLHHLVKCFIMAYATERTLILDSKSWQYHKGGWEKVFKPISNTCNDALERSYTNWPGRSNTQVSELPVAYLFNPRSPFSPPAIPFDLAPQLMKLHGHPIVWWTGQFLKYLLKPQPETQAFLDTSIKKLGFKKPIVGVHVRRTDKIGTEAEFHSIEEYMLAVEEYYVQREMAEPIEKRRVFIASDDPKVIEEARSKYSNYEIIGDEITARLAAESTRYTDSSLNGVILDIHLLSMSDFIVCTFSSHFCRIAYEIMQTNYPDASNHFRSLDDVYHFGGQNSHNREVVVPHIGKHHGEVELKVGDLVDYAGNYWNGYSKGKNLRTNKVGLYPSFKVNDKVEVADFPTYPNVK